MTTIAYNDKDKEIAVDSRMTEGSLIITDKDIKFKVVNGVSFISCGGVSDGDTLIDVYLGASTDKCELDANIIIANDCGVFCASYIENYLNVWKLNHNTAWGSGEKFALAAMDFGCSAKDAVKYAMTRDIYTGGKIRVIKVK
jgi:ATP-dependent protease HslVU (ClpYQ) peptidase subunit